MTPERIRRTDDEKLYQPRIHSQRIRALYQIKTETGEPITVLVDRALGEFVDRHRRRPQPKTSEVRDVASTHSGE